MTTLREKLTAAGISETSQQAHLDAGYLGVAGERVTTLDVDVPDGSHDFGIYPWPEPTAEERAAVEAELAATRGRS